MAYFAGISLGLLVGAFASIVGFDRDRALYPAVVVVVAFYYLLFAVMAGSASAAAVEIAFIALFVVASVVGFKTNLWLIVAALAAHGLFDSVHSDLIHNPGVPAWWPMFCGSIDVTLALYLAGRLHRSKLSAQASLAMMRQDVGVTS